MVGFLRSNLAIRLTTPQTYSRLLWLLVSLEFLFLFIFRQVNLDEGWYLWASKLVYSGQVPYRDFAYTQTPVLPYVYGLGQLLLGAGLYQGRLITLACAVGAYGLTVATARRLGGAWAGVVCLALLATSPFAVAQYTYTATYALTALLMAGAIYIASGEQPEHERAILSSWLLATAVGVRLSVIVVLPVFLLYLISTSPTRLKTSLWAALTTAGWLGLLLGGFWLLSGERMEYNLISFHTDRLMEPHWQGIRAYHTFWKTYNDLRVPFVLGGLGLLLGLLRIVVLWRREPSQERKAVLLQITLCCMAAALVAAQLIPRTTDSYYNSLQVPMITLAGGLLLTQLWPAKATLWRSLRLLLILFALAYNASTQSQAFVRDRYVVYLYPQIGQISTVQAAAHFLQQYTKPDDLLLSFSPHLALEADLQVMPGYEMATFAYRPTWTEAEAARYHVVNNNRLLYDLQQGAPAVAFTKFDLEQIYGEREQILGMLQERYRWVKSVPGFGPFGDELRIYLPPRFVAPTPPVAQPVTLQGGLTLLGYDLTRHVRGDGEKVDVGLYWHTQNKLEQAYTGFVQLLDSNGALAVGWDNPPCHNTCPTTTWLPGEYLRDEYTLPLAALTPGGVYTVQVGLYDANTQQRLSVLNAAGGVLGDAIVLTTLTK